MMGASRLAIGVACLLLATSHPGRASQATDAGGAHESPVADAGFASLGKSTLGDDELRAMLALPDVERRRRLDDVLAAHPEDTRARFLRLDAEVGLGDSKGVLADSELVLAHPGLAGRAKLRVLDWRADALVIAGRPAEALAVADQALAIDDADPRALFARGWARYQQDPRETEAALADLDRALQLEPDQGIGHYRRAVVLQERHELGLAAAAFERAVALEPGDYPTRVAWGELLLDTKDPLGALAQFEAAMRLRPDDAAAVVGRERAHLALGRIDEAIVDAHQALALGATGDDLANAHSFLATALWRKQDFAGAAREFESVRAMSDDRRIARTLAQAQWFSGQFPQAIDSFREQATWPDDKGYTPLWLFIVRMKAAPGEEDAARAELATLAPGHRPAAWTDTLVDLMLGRITLEAARAEADAAETAALRTGRRCEADFYGAERLLQHGQREQAAGLLEEAHAICPDTYTEATAVEWERRRLASSSSPP